ncbi:neuropeptide Y receptor type 2-like [Rhopilema esculentum]|uniref:neuropeptide Y receptor type 2-like n=1 Tax=Rhopilema esculentum TaxID=499914 RepID=UPI0031D449E9
MDSEKMCRTVYPTQGGMTEEHFLVVTVVNCIVALSNIVTNSFLIHALKRTGQLRTLSNKLIVCLSLSDCAIGLILQPCIGLLLIKAYYEDVSCNLEIKIQAFGFGLCHFSGVMLAIIALDRYIHIKFANRYSSIMTSYRAAVLVAGNVVLAVVVAGASVIASKRGFFFVFGLIMASVDSLIVFIIWFTYFLVYRSIKKHVNHMNRITTPGKPKVPSASRTDTVLAKTMVLIMTSQLSCYFPFFIVMTIRSYRSFQNEGSSHALDALIHYWPKLTGHSSQLYEAWVNFYN